jgi:probable HAF family extracellular repeat protein
MPNSDIIPTDVSSSQVGLLPSSLTGTSFSSASENNPSLIGLQTTSPTSSASGLIDYNHDSLTNYSISVSTISDSLPLFNQSVIYTSIPSQSLAKNLTTDFDPLTGSSQNLSRTSITSNDSLLNSNAVFKGKFGNFDHYKNFQLTLQDANGKSESFSLTGHGEGEVFQTDLGEQIIFTGTDGTTKVQISASNNLQFGDYIGSSLKVQTEGSITSGNITLKNTALDNSPGLSLQSGLSELQSATSGSYSITDLSTLFGSNDNYAFTTGINDSGQIVGNFSDNDGQTHAFFYSDGQMTDLGLLSGGFTSQGKAINNSGQIVGTATTSDYINHAFLYSDGKMTDLGNLMGSGYTHAADINNSGQAVGSHNVNRSSDYHASLYSDGKITDLGTLPRGNYSEATAINDAGQVVGYSNKADFIDGINEMTGRAYSSEPGFIESSRYFNHQTHAFLYNNGQMTDLGTLSGGIESEATDINNAGQIVGYSRNNDGYDHAFLYSNGQMTDLGTVSGNSSSYSYAEAINDAGQIIGYSSDVRHPFLYKDGKMTDLNSLISSNSGWTLSYATDINNRGQILGSGLIGGQYHAFLLSPTSTTVTPKYGITVGNISTQGSSVFLQGLKINLTGSKVVTKGGNITFDGPTILNSSTGAYTFNSAKSTATSKGGDITFKNTLDSNSAGASSLNLTAGLGNITFNNAVGGNASLKDLTVNSAKTFTALGDITSQGNITLNAIDDITTASLSSTDSGNVNISLGKIGDKKYDSKGNVTTGNITAKQVDILSDGAFRTHSDIQTKDGDVNITALKDVVVHNITSTNAGISLISATKAITATGEIIGDYGVTALAKQNITTEKIQSANDVVLLNSSQGAVTVNGAITSNSDVSLSAFKNVVTQDITSLDGAVALISSNGNVKAQGAIFSVDNVTLGAAKNLFAQDITSAYGTVALVSSQNNVIASGEINSGSHVAIQANQKVTTGKISSEWGTVALIAKQGTVTTQGDITTNNGDVYISSVGNVVSRNVISNGGAIAIASYQGAVTTGYLRSDGNNTGGKIYVQADGSVRVTGSVFINDANYSIYTGVKKKGLISIAYESGVLKSNKSKFVIGNASINGTAAGIYGLYALKDEDINIFELLKDSGVLLFRVIEEIFKGNDNQPTKDPSNADDTNPITGKAYSSNKKERELVDQLNTAQQRRLNVLIHNKNNPERITEQEVFTKGKVEPEHGCFNLELDRHLGDAADNSKPELGKDITHSLYATYVTGAPGDYLVITSSGLSAFYDGLVRAKGAIVKNGLKPPGSVAEVKTGYGWLKKYLLLPGDSNYIPPTEQEKFIFRKMISQIDREAEVAKDCGLQYFMCFSDKEAGLAAREMFEYKQPPRTKNSVPVHYLKLPIFRKEQP